LGSLGSFLSEDPQRAGNFGNFDEDVGGEAPGGGVMAAACECEADVE